jgi:histidine triad (HIT) family protein
VSTASGETPRDCPFCAIARGEAPAEIICERESWLAFFPLKPATPGHTLVVPRRHVADLWSADSELAIDLMGAVIDVGHAIQAALAPDGMNLITSSGDEAEQTVYHLHLHVVPRYRDDGFGEIWPPERQIPDVELEGIPRRIRDACRAIRRDSVPAQTDDHGGRRQE